MFSETLSQPQCWEPCLTRLLDDTQFSDVVDQFSDRSEWNSSGVGQAITLQ
jgi:hypothetical protein